MLIKFKNSDYAGANMDYSSIKYDLKSIVTQIKPLGKDLLQAIGSLPEQVNTIQQDILGRLAGYSLSVKSLLIKIQKNQFSFGVNTFFPNKYSSKIFIVHGHDTSMLGLVSSFVKKLELTPIILHEQPNKGRTIIEKFVDYSDVGFAVVLLSPDDTAVKDEKKISRARQNVIFELGYFLGKLGRERVVALYKSSVEIPSDYSGVLYVEFNEFENWRIQLCKELKAVGFNIDINVILD